VKRALAAPLVLLAAMAACSTRDPAPGAPVDAGRTDAPAGERDAGEPEAARDAPEPPIDADISGCAPAVDASVTPGTWVGAALPSGACDDEGFSCAISTRDACACDGFAGPITGWICRCQAGAWDCGAWVQSHTQCPDACPADAAPE
jgi:hypothetical protein